MLCTSCKDNQISFKQGCYLIYNNSDKSFYKPENESEISSCKQSFDKYIKDDSYVCVEDKEDGYYISNNITGLISRCDSNCKTCSESNTHCD